MEELQLKNFEHLYFTVKSFEKKNKIIIVSNQKGKRRSAVKKTHTQAVNKCDFLFRICQADELTL